MTIISGDRATVIPVGWTRCAPIANVRATSTHRLESGIQASKFGRPPPDVWPSTTEATAAGCAGLTWISTHRPAATWFCLLKNCPTR
jgi:hypothetical protein